MTAASSCSMRPQITRRQLTGASCLTGAGQRRGLLTQGLIEATDLLLRQFEQSGAYQGYLQLQQAGRSWMQSAAGHADTE